MSILSVGIEQGKNWGITQGKAESILNLLEENGPVSKTTRGVYEKISVNKILL